DALAKRFPEIAVETNQRIIDHGDIITTGGFMAWVDVGLLLVDKILGRAVRAETARFVLPIRSLSRRAILPAFLPSGRTETWLCSRRKTGRTLGTDATRLSRPWRQQRGWKGAHFFAGSSGQQG